ncbi:MAG: phospholipid carrier-dependent glycosyltransferase [Calothrix sp. MO_192.B10]|nr:phospholipid carrier-dependent glycosyltransferase [Calothrix sp. MO_192.B10]
MNGKILDFKSKNSLLILAIIWLLGAVCDRIWFTVDHSIPGWDQADYLTGTLNYWRALQNPQWLNGEWWQSLWLLSSKIPPLTYIATAYVQNIFGTGQDQATLVILVFSAILLGSVYGLGTILFSQSVGLWAAALCQVLPGLYRFRLEFLLDYPLAAVVTLTFFCLTAWRVTGRQGERGTRGAGDKGSGGQEKFPHSPTPSLPHSLTPSLLLPVAFGLCLGLALMVKQTALLFLLTPIVWVFFDTLFHRRWGRLLQLLGAFWVSTLVFGSWYRTNWLFILTSGKRATVDSAIAEGDAPLNTIQAWTFYWHQLPHQVSIPLLILPIGLLLIYWKRTIQVKSTNFPSPRNSLKWLAIFFVGAYLLSSLNPNKDDRYVLPYLPIISVFLSYGLTRFQNLWGKRIRWGTLSLAALLMLLNLFPIGGIPGTWMTQFLSPKVQHYPYIGEEFPHRQVIAQIIQTQPYLRSTLGVLPSTLEINQHNLNYYGALANFQVYGRQVGTRNQFVPQDGRSLDWFLTKTNNQGSIPEAQSKIVQIVEKGGDFQLNKAWNLPDGSAIQLYHRQTPPIEVKPVSQQPQTQITLSQVKVPETAPPGVPLPVTYTWNGNWKELQQGLVLLTWRSLNSPGNKSKYFWIHDHGIGMGNLDAGTQQPQGTLQVTEKLAMLPPAEITPGNYTLEATYLNRVTGEVYPIQVPNITLNINPKATPTPAPELDLLTQLRTLAANLPQGTKALEKVFDEIGRINQYDPIQDYLVQIRLSLGYRLEHIAPNKEWAYGLALANVLQKRVNDAIAAFKKVTQLDSQNPYAWAYLAFVQLYNWQPAAAQKSLQPSLAKKPDSPEFQALDGVAALMQGNLIKVWQTLQKLNL